MVAGTARGYAPRHLHVTIQSTEALHGFEDSRGVHRNTIWPPRHSLAFRFTRLVELNMLSMASEEA